MSVISLKKANCKNCYKCVRVCPVKSILIKDQQAEIIPHDCILCGRCLEAVSYTHLDVYKRQERVFVIAESIRKGISLKTIHEIAMIDMWFLDKFRSLVELEERIKQGPLTEGLLREAKRKGYTDQMIATYLLSLIHI